MSIEQVQMIERLRAALAPFAAAAPAYRAHRPEVLILGGEKGKGRLCVADFRRAAEELATHEQEE